MPDSQRRYRFPLITAALVVLAVSVVTAGVREAKPASLNEQMYEIASGLRCPVCRNLSVADSPSLLAEEMRSTITQRLRAGQNAEQIRAYFADRYGEWILLDPRGGGVGWVLWLAPPVALIAGLVVVGRVLRSRRPAPVEALSESDREGIMLELSRMPEYE